MKKKDLNEDYVAYDGKVVILGNEDIVVLEKDFKDKFTFADLEKIEDLFYLQYEEERKLQEEVEAQRKQIIAQQEAIHHLLAFDRWLKCQTREVLENILH
jgi:hypothetical protein